MKRMQYTLHFCTLVALASGCGNAGESPATSCYLCGSFSDVSGVISAADGSLAAMQGWVMATFERDTGVARVESISNNAGKFKFSRVRTEQTQTLALLSPNYRLQGVLSMPGTDSKNIRQWFRYKSNQVPKLINDGNILKFVSQDNLDLQNYTVTAQQTNQELPNGVSKLSLTKTASLTSALPLLAPQDIGGLSLVSNSAKSASPDYNGNGIIKWLDPYDADKDSTKLDLFVADDSSPKQVFNNAINYLAVQVSRSADQSTSEKLTYLNYSTQLGDGLESTPTVTIRGADSLLGKTQIVLNDDGTNTKTYTGQTKIAQTANISTFDVLFLELKFTSGGKTWAMDFPWVFSLDISALPSATDATAKSAWDSGNLVVTNPFKAPSSTTDPLNSFTWAVRVYDDTNLIWTSTAKLFDASKTATNATITVPKAVFNFNSGAKYKYSVTLQSDDQIPGNPAYVIQSLKFDISAP